MSLCPATSISGHTPSTPHEAHTPVIAGVGTARRSFIPAPHPLVGTTAFTADHASGYSQPLIGVGALLVSLWSYHPLGVLTVASAKVVGGGSETTVAVDVYCGRYCMLCVGTSLIDVGGHAPNDAIDDAAISFAPAPPVAYDGYDSSHVFGSTPSDSQIPDASRGSVGIHPFSSPSL